MSDDSASKNSSTNLDIDPDDMEDQVCTKCPWTLFTGGMDEEGHAACCGGTLVPASKVPVKKTCQNCKADEDSEKGRSLEPCRYHPGEKQDFKRMMCPEGAHVVFTWSCCGLKKDYKHASKEVVDIHADGCQTSAFHKF